MPNIIRMRVFDRPGVLDRITGLIRRNGVNIKTITSGNVAEGVSQITISLGDHARLDTLGDRFSEMTSVRQWERCTPATHMIRELLLMRFSADQKGLIEDGMRVIREEDGMAFVEYVADPVAVDETLARMNAAGVACARGGAIGVSLAEGDL